MAPMDKYSKAFIEEAWELLAELETSLLDLEDSPDDDELVGSIFRAMHTIKGSGAMFGFDDISTFTHDLETLFDLVRSGKAKATKEIIDITLKSRDHIGAMLEAADGGDPIDEHATKRLKISIQAIIEKNSTKENSNNKDEDENIFKEEDVSSNAVKIEETFRIKIKPNPHLFLTGSDMTLLIKELRELGTCTVIADTDKIPLLDEINPETCYTNWEIILTTSNGKNAICDVFIFIEDNIDLNIELLDSEDTDNLNEKDEYKKLGELLVERGTISEDDLKKVLGSQMRIGELLISNGLVTETQVTNALSEQKHIRDSREKRKTIKKDTGIRVASDKLDSLVDLVGELVIVQARLSQYSSQNNQADLVSITEEVERLTSELRDSTLSIRMLTIGTTFSRFKRLVRDLSAELGKSIEMVTQGADTELDKTVIDRLNDPMVHLIRNCIDHGIEGKDARVAAGKPEVGTVHISAMHSGSDVLIKIKDDGAGLDPEHIRQKAIEKGIITADAELTKKEIYKIIFMPGFSTKQSISSVSGRGVGMDVVKQTINALHGTVEIDSIKGEGTIVSIKLPLTLAIIEGLQVVIENEIYVLPLPIVEECIELTSKDVTKSHGRQFTNVRGEIVPYISLRQHFNLTGETPNIEQVVITRCNNKRVGFLVDSVIGAKQTVIKSLGNVYKGVKGISGATIMGDGTVALILDAPQLIERAEVEESALVTA